jgi:hypothetical protein
MRWWRGRAWAEPEEGKDRWGPPVSQARRGVKVARGEAFPCEGGDNRAGRHRRAQLGREGELGQLSGRGLVGRGRAAGWGRKKEVGHGWARNRSWAQLK